MFRSTAYQRLGSFGKAFKDSEFAIVAASKLGKREKIGEAQQRRAITLFNLKRYDDALFSLEKSIENSSKETSSHSVWKAKIQSYLPGGKFKFLRFYNNEKNSNIFIF